MTVSATYNPARLNCDGLTTMFAFSFQIDETSDLRVILRSSTGSETVLTETTHYTVSATNSDYSTGGTVTTVSTYASGNVLLIERNESASQDSEFYEGMATLYSAFEDALDKLTRICQQLLENSGRSPMLSSSSAYDDLTLPDPVSGAYLRTKTDLSGYENVYVIDANGTSTDDAGWYRSTMTTDEAVNVASGEFLVCILDPNGSNRNFDLTVPGDFKAIICNKGPNLITFDSAGIAESIGAGDKKTFIYDATGTTWL